MKKLMCKLFGHKFYAFDPFQFGAVFGYCGRCRCLLERWANESPRSL